MIKAILFDFGQTLADSAEGFRSAEKGAETRMFEDLGLASWQDFLSGYRKLRQEFHANSNFSRVALWQAIYLHYGRGCIFGVAKTGKHAHGPQLTSIAGRVDAP